MPKPYKKYVNSTFGQMHTRIATPHSAVKRPLICTHMFPQSGRNFESFIESASDERIVVAPDFPGHGESDALARPISAESYASSIWEVIDALDLLDQFGQVDLFGVHAGAKLAVEIAHQRPGDVGKVVLSSASVLHPEEVDQLKASFKPIPLDEEGTRVRNLWDLVVKSRHETMTLEMCATAFAEILRGGENYEWGHHAVFEYNKKFPQKLQTLTHPVALLNPKDELYEMTFRSLDYLQNATLFDLPDWGHGYLDVYADTVAELVCNWLDAETQKSTVKVDSFMN